MEITAEQNSLKTPQRKLRLGCAAIFLLSFVVSSTYYLTTWEDLKIIKQKQILSKVTSRRTTSMSRLPLNPKQKEAINEERLKIQQEMEGYNFTGHGLPPGITLDELVMEKGGEPIKMMLLATWRTGSSFTGSLIASHPGTYFEFEPLIYFATILRPGEMENEGLQVLDHILSCNYSFNRASERLGRSITNEFMFTAKIKPIYQNPGVLNDPNFYSAICRLFPFQLMKTVRLPLGMGKKLLENKKHKNLRILFLVRDPRAIMMSRWLADWCGPPDCTDVVRLCVQMEQDFEEAKLLRELYPDRFLALRYEDISLNMEVASKKILKFFRLQFHPKVEQFLKDHTKRNGTSLITRDSNRHTFSWMEDFYGKDFLRRSFFRADFARLLEIQNDCSKAMEYWGYPKIIDREQLNSSFVPLLKPPWPEMNVGG